MKKIYEISFLNKTGACLKAVEVYGTYDEARETAYLELHNSTLKVVLAKIYQNGRCIKRFEREMNDIY